MTVATRLLGVDYGTVRVGLAITDPDRKIASPLITYEWQKRPDDLAFFKTLVIEYEVSQLVVGLPVHLDGREGKKAVEARAFGRCLGEATNLPVVFWDERFTSVEAERSLLFAGLTNKKRKHRRDQVAAQIFLQSYLDAGCPGKEEIGALDC